MNQETEHHTALAALVVLDSFSVWPFVQPARPGLCLHCEIRAPQTSLSLCLKCHSRNTIVQLYIRRKTNDLDREARILLYRHRANNHQPLTGTRS